MRKTVGYFDTMESITLTQVGEEDCLIDFAGERVVLSYDAACDLAMRLAFFMQRIDDLPEPAEALLN